MESEFAVAPMAFDNVYKIRFPRFGDDSRGAKKIFEFSEGSPFASFRFFCDEAMVLQSRRGILRGMHYQEGEQQKKMIYVLSGRLFIAVVDLRQNQKTYGQWKGLYVSALDSFGVYIPADFAIGTLAEEDSSFLMLYCGEYVAGSERGFRFDDMDVGIEWPLSKREIQVADKDLLLPTFRDRAG